MDISSKMTSPANSPNFLTEEGNNIKDLLDDLEDSMDDVGEIKRQFMSRIIPEDEEFNSSQVPVDTVTKREVQDLIESIPKPMVQKPIQPGSTPADDDNRFLCWNNTGIIRAQNSSEDDQSIDVMFHDVEKHSSLNFKNEPNYVYGSLSDECVAVGSNGKYGTGPSSIHGINLLETNRDTREWEIELPHVELIDSLTVGAGFVAVATDQRNLRLFTNSGMQSYVFTLPGQILCMTANDKQLMIIYHNGAGHSDDQNLSMFIYYVDLLNNIVRQTHRNVPVALGKRSPLAWAGFSDEGTPCTYDYGGSVRIYRSELGKAWVPILNTKDLTTSALDHYFVVGIGELSQVIRAVKCRRSRFPDFSTETTEMLSFSLPMCDIETDKGRLEEEHIRLRLAEISYKRMLNMDGYSMMAEAANESNEKLLVNTILRLFALYIKEQKDDAAKNLIYMIPKAHMSKLPEFAWKINRPQYFIDSLNKAMEEREQLETELTKIIREEDDDVKSVTSFTSGHSFGKDLRRDSNRNRKNESSPNKLKPLPLDKLMTSNVNRIIESDSESPVKTSNKRVLASDAEESGDENDLKRAKKTKSISYNLFSKKRPVNA